MDMYSPRLSGGCNYNYYYVSFFCSKPLNLVRITVTSPQSSRRGNSNRGSTTLRQLSARQTRTSKFFLIGTSRSKPHTNHSCKKIAVPMYVCMYVAIRCPRVHYAVCTCTYHNSVKIINVYRMLTLIVAHQSRRTEQQHE